MTGTRGRRAYRALAVATSLLVSVSGFTATADTGFLELQNAYDLNSLFDEFTAQTRALPERTIGKQQRSDLLCDALLDGARGAALAFGVLQLFKGILKYAIPDQWAPSPSFYSLYNVYTTFTTAAAGVVSFVQRWKRTKRNADDRYADRWRLVVKVMTDDPNAPETPEDFRIQNEEVDLLADKPDEEFGVYALPLFSVLRYLIASEASSTDEPDLSFFPSVETIAEEWSTAKSLPDALFEILGAWSGIAEFAPEQLRTWDPRVREDARERVFEAVAAHALSRPVFRIAREILIASLAIGQRALDESLSDEDFEELIDALEARQRGLKLLLVTTPIVNLMRRQPPMKQDPPDEGTSDPINN